MESIGRLAGGVAHDFNNMLGVILGHAELGLTRVEPSDPVCADLNDIRKAVERSAGLTRQLLAFARRQVVAPRVLAVNEAVAGLLKMLQRLIGEDIELCWLPATGVWPVRMDPSQLDQVLANLCVNARDAIAGMGRVTITTANVTVDEADGVARVDASPGDYVRIAVSDDGQGIDADVAAHIFEPFYTTKEHGKGTGLGLATVYGAVRQNNGFITVASEPGHGATFSIHLPRHAAADGASPVADAVVSNPRGTETILLVEDEEALLSLAGMLLEQLGYRVLPAGSPDAALRFAQEHGSAIDLLLTDVIMPEMDGKALACSVRVLRPTIKLMYMSGYTADVIAPHGVLDGVTHFIQKPFRFQELAAKVREALDKG
jgi:CheY-like chemotaxis protein